ncbi:Ubiquinone/menaquinone biosynthesis C-methyltransferase UbiE [compost metagenome]
MYEIYHMFVLPQGKAGEAGADLMEQYGGPMAQEAVKTLGPAPTDRVVEIGFGPGLGLQSLACVVTEGHITGVDPASLMHKRAASRNADAIAQGRMSLVRATAASLPFADGTFDGALSVDNLHFWPDPLSGLQEVKRVLRIGSTFVCAFTPPSGGRAEDLRDLFADAKFTDFEVQKTNAGVIIKASASS